MTKYSNWHILIISRYYANYYARLPLSVTLFCHGRSEWTYTILALLKGTISYHQSTIGVHVGWHIWGCRNMYRSYSFQYPLIPLIIAHQRHFQFKICGTIEGFHVTSYQANFASHRTFDRHVGFLRPWRGIGKHKKMSETFYLAHTTIPNYNGVTRILAHTLMWNFKSCYEVNPK